MAGAGEAVTRTLPGTGQQRCSCPGCPCCGCAVFLGVGSVLPRVSVPAQLLPPRLSRVLPASPWSPGQPVPLHCHYSLTVLSSPERR